MKTVKLPLVAIVLITSLVLFSCSGKKEAAAPAAGSAAVAEKPFVIRVGADSANFSYQFRVAQKAGIFDKYNIKAEILTFSYGIDTINAAILGETDSAEAMDFAAASRFSESNKLRVLATITTSVPGGSHLYVRHNDIKTPADLKGKRIGVQKATANEYTWARLFEKYGLKKEDVNHVYLGSNAELLAAYQSNEIDALWVGADIEKAIQEIPASRNLGDNSLSGYLSRGFLLLDADVIAKEPAGVERFLKALDEATAYIKGHPDETAKIAYDDLKIPLDAALKSISAINYELRLTQEDLDQITNVANWSIDNGLIRNRYNINDFVDLKPLRNALPDRVTVQ
ncbi:ABC transporter substrate-binding protein [Leadbettera azotonutricia]|uniref:Putative lipoprotein n=1 Tax=Leadbettera azotonutricia (strain ATCC BAA-888 / DSM 13862 / ZAS-9) TaxID=545695 RepID=F5YCM9_LEAAZ|nr:ABC transporter substrate-binding protein [Leadbettera azotonutricia]AEF83080.1 putative lipoprotein [Leadbettera azotonutricia ZAS-9]